MDEILNNEDSGIGSEIEASAEAVKEAIGIGEKPIEEPKLSAKNKNKGIPKLAYIGIVIAMVAIAVAALFAANLLGQQTVVAGDNVSVYYTGSFTNGTVFGSNVGYAPLNFTAGSTQLIQGFSEAVIGMHPGENKTVTLPPQEAYGEVNSSLIVTVPLSRFSNSSSVAVGEIVTTSFNGRVLSGVVISKNASYAVVNMNPPLAGKTLVFTIKLVKILSK
ncbi:MAG: peptidylprolyl isomerase [Candidatus Micrarchaeaceae archaeon]